MATKHGAHPSLFFFPVFCVKKSNDFRPSQSQRRRRMKSWCVGSCCLEPFNMSIVCVVLYFLLCVLRQAKAAAAAPPSIHPSTAYYPSDGRREEKRVVMVLSKDHVKISCCLWAAGDMSVGWWGVMTLNLTGSLTAALFSSLLPLIMDFSPSSPSLSLLSADNCHLSKNRKKRKKNSSSSPSICASSFWLRLAPCAIATRGRNKTGAAGSCVCVCSTFFFSMGAASSFWQSVSLVSHHLFSSFFLFSFLDFYLGALELLTLSLPDSTHSAEWTDGRRISLSFSLPCVPEQITSISAFLFSSIDAQKWIFIKLVGPPPVSAATLLLPFVFQKKKILDVKSIENDGTTYVSLAFRQTPVDSKAITVTTQSPQITHTRESAGIVCGRRRWKMIIINHHFSSPPCFTPFGWT